MKNHIAVARTSEDRRAVIEYVEKRYFKYFNTIPSESEIYLYASTDTTVTGAIALDFENSSGRMPLESIYRLDRLRIPLPLNTSNGAQFGKWNADTTDVSLPLLYAACLYAIKQRKTYGWLNHSLAVHRVLTRKGIYFLPIDAVLCLENVRTNDRAFYEKNPDVQCYIMELTQVVDMLKKNVLEAVDRQMIIFGEL